MIRTVTINGKPVKQTLRVCECCGSKDWVKDNPTAPKTILCAKCATNKMRFDNPIQQEKHSDMKQDEAENRRMIDEFLARRAS